MTIPSAILQLLPDIRNDIKWRSNEQTGPKSCFVNIKRLSGKEMGSHTNNNSWFHNEKENLITKDPSIENINVNHELEEENNVENGVHVDSDKDSSKRKRLEALNLFKKSLMISKDSSPSSSTLYFDVNQNTPGIILKSEIAKRSPEYMPDNNLNIENNDFDPQFETDLEFEEVSIQANFESEASCDDVSGTGNGSSSETNLPSVELRGFNEDEREENLSKSILQTITSEIRNPPHTNSDVSQNISSFDGHISVQYEESNAIEIASNEFDFEELPDIDLPYQSNDIIDMNLNKIISEERVFEHEDSCIAQIEKSPSKNSDERVPIEQCESNLEEREQSENNTSGDDSVSTLGDEVSETTESSSKNSEVVTNVKESGKFKLSHLHGNISEIPNNEIISFIKLRYGTKWEDNDSIKSDVTSVLEREYDVNQEIADLQVALDELYQKSLDKIRILEHQANSDSSPSEIDNSTLTHSNPSIKCSEQLNETTEERTTSILHQKLVNEAIERVIESHSVKLPSKQPSKSNHPNLNEPTDINLQPKQISNSIYCSFKPNFQKSISSTRKKTTNSKTDVRLECEEPRNLKDVSPASITSSNVEMKDKVPEMIGDKQIYKCGESSDKVTKNSVESKRKYSSCSEDNYCRKKRKKMKMSHFLKRSSDDTITKYERRSSNSSDKQKSSKEHKRPFKRHSYTDGLKNGSNKSSIKRRSSDKYEDRRRTSNRERSSCSSDSRSSSRSAIANYKTKTSFCLIEKTKMKTSCTDKLSLSIDNLDPEYYSGSQLTQKKFSRIISHEMKHNQKKIPKELTEDKTKVPIKIDESINSLKNVRDITNRRKYQDDSISEKKENDDCLPDLTMANKSSIDNDNDDNQIISKESENCIVYSEHGEEDSCDGDTDVFEEDEEILSATGTKSNDCINSLEINGEKVNLKVQLSARNKESRITFEKLHSISENNLLNGEECVHHSVTSSPSSVLFTKDSSIKHKPKLKVSSKTEDQTVPVLKEKYSELTRLLTSNPSKVMPTITSSTIESNGDSLLCDASLITVRSLKENDDHSIEFQTVIDGASHKRKMVKSGASSSTSNIVVPNTEVNRLNHEKNKLCDQGAIAKDVDILKPFENSRKATENCIDYVSGIISKCKLISDSKQKKQFVDVNNLVNQDSDKNIGNCTASDFCQLAQKNSKSVDQDSNTESDEIHQTVIKVTKVSDYLNCTEKYKKNMKITSENEPCKSHDGSSPSNNRELRKEIVSCTMPNSKYLCNDQEGTSKQFVGGSALQMTSTSSPISTTKEYSSWTGQSSTSQSTAKDHSLKSINEFPNTTWINLMHPRPIHSVFPPTENIKDKRCNPNQITNARPSNISQPNRYPSISNSIINSGRSPMISPNEIVLSSNQTEHRSNPSSVSTSNVDSTLISGFTNPNPTNLSSIHQSVGAVSPLYPQSSKQGKCEKNSATEKAPSIRVKEKNTPTSNPINDLKRMAERRPQLPLLSLPGTYSDHPLQHGYSGSLFQNNVNYRYPGINSSYDYHPNLNQNYLQQKNQCWVNSSNDLNRFIHPSISQRNISPANQFTTGTLRSFRHFPHTNQPIRMIQPEKVLVGSNLHNNLNHSYIQSAPRNQMISQNLNSNNTQSHFQNFHHISRQSTTNALSNLQSSNHLQNSSNLLNYGMNRPTHMVQSFGGLPSYHQKDVNQNNAHPNNLNRETILTNNANPTINVIQHSNLNLSGKNSVNGLSNVQKSLPLLNVPNNLRNHGTNHQNQVPQHSEASYVQNNVYNPHANTTVRISYPSEQKKCSKERNIAIGSCKQNVQTSSPNNIVERAAPPLTQKRAIAVKRMPSLFQCQSSNKRKNDFSDSAGSKVLKVSLEHREDPSSDIRRVIENLIPNTEMNLGATVSATSSSLVVPVTSSDSGHSPIRSSVIASASTSGEVITVDLEPEQNEREHASLIEDKCTRCRADLQAHMYPCCPTAIYCEKECQVKHWPIHYGECTNGTVIRN